LFLGAGDPARLVPTLVMETSLLEPGREYGCRGGVKSPADSGILFRKSQDAGSSGKAAVARALDSLTAHKLRGTSLKTSESLVHVPQNKSLRRVNIALAPVFTIDQCPHRPAAHYPSQVWVALALPDRRF
jgi:hypothetical protein